MCEVVRIPSGALALSRQADFARGIGAEQVQGETAQEGEVVRGIVQADSTGILAEGHVQAPMQAVFDAPMGAHRVQDVNQRPIVSSCQRPNFSSYSG